MNRADDIKYKQIMKHLAETGRVPNGRYAQLNKKLLDIALQE